MQSLDIISVNLWQILISLCNLLIIFLLIKKFLFAPVKKAMQKRSDEIASKYNEAESAKAEALQNKSEWEQKIATAETEADDIIKQGTISAQSRSDKIVAQANIEAEEILRRAKDEARLEKQKMQFELKKEIAGISSALAEKMLEREINEQDHKALIDSFIDDLGEPNE